MTLVQDPLFLAFLRGKGNSEKDTTEQSKRPDRIICLPLSLFWNASLAPAGKMIAGIALTSSTAGLISARWLRSHGSLEATAIGSWCTCMDLFWLPAIWLLYLW